MVAAYLLQNKNKGGRPRTFDRAKAKELKAKGLSPKEVAFQLKILYTTMMKSWHDL